MALAAIGLASKLVVAAPLSPTHSIGIRAMSASCGRFSVELPWRRSCDFRLIIGAVRCDGSVGRELRTCRNCKAQFDFALNHATACRRHTSHFGGKRATCTASWTFSILFIPDVLHQWRWFSGGHAHRSKSWETKRKFESVYSGGTMDAPGSGKISHYWHCCGSEDPFDPGCTSAPHASYDD